MDLQTILQGHEFYQKIQGLEVLDELLPLYLEYADRVAQDCDDVNQGATIKQWVGKPDLNSVSVVFHEKVEIGVYLDLGYSHEDIATGVAHKMNYDTAHNAAERHELGLLQFVGREALGVEIPLYVLFCTRPAIAIFQPDRVVQSHLLIPYLNHVKKRVFEFNWEAGNYIDYYQQPELEDPEHIEEGFRVFEMFGNTFPGWFKDKVPQEIKDAIERENQKRKLKNKSIKTHAINFAKKKKDSPWP